MSWKKVLTAGIMTTMLSCGVQASPSDWVSPNVPLSSPLYRYIEKLDGLGYLRSMPTGAKPYTRLQMAKWLREIQAEAAQRPLPKYMRGITKQMERELAPELKILAGEQAVPSLSLKEVKLEAATYSGAALRYRQAVGAGPLAGYQPLNVNNNGYRYGEHGNVVALAWLAGKLSQDMAVALQPRFSYDSDQHGDVSLISGYITSRLNGIAVQIGKDPVFWGHGDSGSLILGNNMQPLTGIKLSNLQPYRTRGLFRFLGEMNFTGLYSELESNRTALTENEVDKPSFVALRGDFTPQRNFTFGLTLTSMLGGKGRSLSSGDYWDWLLGRNDEAADDKWNNIAGADFKLRLPHWQGVQLYGELYGEDQGHYHPIKMAKRGGIYIPRLSGDGAWDLRLEFARTNGSWYVHQLYTAGYVYKGNIIGDPLGHDADKYYLKLGRYLTKDSRLFLCADRTVMERSTAIPQTINSYWLQYHTRLREDVFFDGSVGLARISNLDFINGLDDTNRFAAISVRWVY